MMHGNSPVGTVSKLIDQFGLVQSEAALGEPLHATNAVYRDKLNQQPTNRREQRVSS